MTASSGSAAGRKAAVQAGKYIAQFCVDIFEKKEAVEQSKKELKEARKGRPEYSPVPVSEEETELSAG